MQLHCHASLSNARGALRSLPPIFHTHVQLYTTTSYLPLPPAHNQPSRPLLHHRSSFHSQRHSHSRHSNYRSPCRVVSFVAARCARDFCSRGVANPCRTPPLSTVDRKCVVHFSRSTAFIASLCLYLRRVSHYPNLPQTTIFTISALPSLHTVSPRVPTTCPNQTTTTDRLMPALVVRSSSLNPATPFRIPRSLPPCRSITPQMFVYGVTPRGTTGPP